MYLNRLIDQELNTWKISINRKPLLLRGARQVGKTSSVKNLSKGFKYFIEINFDENSLYSTIFEKTQTIDEICEQISILTNTPIIEGETLLFFDEIQTCIKAISSLRYFYERRPGLHVIAAGSLLEFVLSELPSFGVGRVRSMFMYPLSYHEFLLALNEHLLLNQILQATTAHPIADGLHHKLIKLYKKFLIIGGMPEAVRTYIESNDLLAVQNILNDLLISIQADFVKYKKQISGARLNEVFDAIANQTATKFTYSYPKATMNNLQIKEAIELLKMAGLIHSVTHTAANGIPLGAETNPKNTKFLLFDSGIFQRILGLNISDLMLEDDFNAVNKGNIAELHVGLELLKAQSCYQKTELYYWQRDAKNSQAEVDYLIQIKDKIVPLEVKSGTKGSMQSMYIFLKEKHLDKGVRISFENFSKLDQIVIIPIYATFYLKTLFEIQQSKT
jgi:uncharacterized protein